MISAADAKAHVGRSAALQPLQPRPGSQMPDQRSAVSFCEALARHKRVDASAARLSQVLQLTMLWSFMSRMAQISSNAPALEYRSCTPIRQTGSVACA